MGIYLSKDGISYLWSKIKNKFYIKPSTGIPKSDLASSVQASLGKADTALQKHQDISGKVDNTAAGADSLLSKITNSWTATPTDNTYFIRQDTSSKNEFGRVKFSTLWSYIKSKVESLGYTKNTGTITGIKMNGASKGTSGVVDLGTVITAHQDISGKQDKSTAVTHSANTAVGSATKPVYIAANGVATPISHSINSDVPANAKFTDTTYNDATQSAHGLMTAADKKKLDGMDLTKYLPKSGGVMTGAIDTVTNGVDITVGSNRSNNSNPTLVAGGSYEVPDVSTNALKNYKSLIGSYHNTKTGAWFNMISVRHRNGYDDGANYGMYLYSALTTGGNLIWNKQTAANTWQGERTLLDSINYSNYAAPLSHTHKNIDSIGNVGYYGSDKASTNGWYKFHSGTLTGYNDRTARLMLTYMYGYNNFGTIFFHARCNNGNTIQIQRLLWEVRSGFEDGDVVAVAKGNDYSLYVYNRNTQWGRIKIRVLESGGTSSDWDMTLASNFTKESTAPTPTIVASDGCTVANAKTLTDSGWIATTRNTTFTVTSTVKCRKYGQLVEVRGEVTFSDTCGSPTVCTLPAGYRPATVVQACGITPSGKQYMIKADTSGVISFGSDSGSTFVKGTTYRVDLTYLLG